MLREAAAKTTPRNAPRSTTNPSGKEPRESVSVKFQATDTGTRLKLAEEDDDDFDSTSSSGSDMCYDFVPTDAKTNPESGASNAVPSWQHLNSPSGVRPLSSVCSVA